MTTVAIVPVQDFSRAKSRLAPRLDATSRAELMAQLLTHVLDQLRAARAIDSVLVVTPDPAVQCLAASAGATVVHQPGSGLNAAVRLGQQQALAGGWTRAVVVLADLPLLRVEHVDRMLSLGHGDGVVLAPDRRGGGTNLLALCPPDAVAPAFGEGSRRQHLRAAWAAGLPAREYWSVGTAFDLDLPEDLDALTRYRERVPDGCLEKGVPGWRDRTAG